MTVHAKKVFSDSHRTLVVLQSTTADTYQVSPNICMVGSVEPVALIVACGAGGDYALDMQENMVPLDELRRQVPALDSIVNPLIAPRKLIA